MFASLRRIALPVLSMATLAACHEPAPSAAPALSPLPRPVVAVTVQNGRVLVPAAAVLERGGIPGVFVLTDGRQARFRMVRTGKATAGRVEALSGLSSDETLVTGDLRDVHDGSPIEQH